ncbi:hypothetical protein CAC42_2418 [Sphaceloma murrayae]|uniref:Uncharacterized protein n=1 Tax=Sphaceloma murrayae TaxID=2082308 RepID=A0A2K1QW08_9PEZI|nr:hypothetical protein CAC42_2418 [Sphaceloma murrayae]
MTDRIGEPVILAGIPKPFGGPDSKTQAAPVWQYTPTRVKARSEVVVAVDGEGLYIYDIENPRLITSYAVPPETRFLCKPTSLIRKKVDRKLERVTYAAVQLKDSQTTRLLGFIEERSKTSSPGQEQSPLRQMSIDFPDANPTPLSLHAVPIDPNNQSLDVALQLCVVHKTLSVESYAGDLSCRHYSYKQGTGRRKEYEYEYALLVSLNHLRTGLLLQRHDVTMQMEDGGIDEHQSNILFLVRKETDREKTGRAIMVARLSGTSTIDKPGRLLRKHLIIRIFVLPQAKGYDAYDFQLSDDTLHLSAQSGDDMLLWNFAVQESDAAPVSNVGTRTHLNLGHSEVLACSDTTCSLINTVWRARRGEAALATKESQPGEKRGRDAAVSSLHGLELVRYFPDSRMAVGIAPCGLVGLPVDIVSKSKKRRAEMTLAEALGRGEPQRSAKVEKWLEDFSTSVQGFVDSSDAAGLEGFVARDMGLENHADRTDGDGEEDQTEDVFARSGETTWIFPKHDSVLISKSDPMKAKRVLSACVDMNRGDTKDSYHIRLFSPSLFKWLAILGVFSTESTKGRTGVLMSSLAKYDSTLATMETILRWKFHLNVMEVVQALQLAIDSLDSPIPQADDVEVRDEQLQESEDANSIADATQAAEADLAYAIASLNHGTAIRSGLFNSIFDRLFAFPTEDIVAAFKSTLSPRELVFLINLLRIELADGRWTLRYIDQDLDDEAEEGPADSSISIIVKLLNSAVDAVGPTGWNVGLSSDKQLNTDEMLLILRAEINAVLEGCQEYLSIADTLQEFTKFCALAKIDGHKSKRKVDPVRNPGFVKEDAEDVILPMGARTDRIEATRVSKGGVVKQKSKNQRGQEISMRVGRYSVDRIRV